MTINRILWLEDKPKPISYHVEEINNLCRKSNITLHQVETPRDFQKKLLSFMEKGDQNYLLILDILIFGVQELIVSQEFFSPKPLQPLIAPTMYRSGHDVGLLLYEKIFVEDYMISGKTYKPKLKPPPIMFLNISSLDFSRYRARFEIIKQKISELHENTDIDRYIQWARKFDFNVRVLEEMLEVVDD